MARRRAVPGISLKLDHEMLREGVNTLEQLAARVTFDFDDPQELFKYRAIDDGSKAWTPEELQAINVGVMQVGTAFDFLATTAVFPQNAFNLAMLENSGTEILFIRVSRGDTDPISIQNYQYQYGDYAGQIASFGYPAVGRGGCKAYQESSGPPLRPAAVICNGAMIDQWSNGQFTGIVTQYAVVHELGHLFDYRVSNGLTAPISSGYSLLDCAVPDAGTVMGNFGNSWVRGRRGWGTGPAQYLNNGVLVRYLTHFQQNSENIPLEAAADSFLNWVYRLNTSGGVQPADPCLQPTLPPPTHWTGPGFLNRDWDPNYVNAFPGHNDGTAGTLDTSLPGDVRHFDFDQRIRQIFASRGW